MGIRVYRPYSVSEKMQKYIQSVENLRLKYYRDVDQEDIGYGHRILPNEDFSAGINEAQALEIFQGDIKKICVVLEHALFLVPVSQGQVDALVDFIYNVGFTNFKTSTLYKYLQAKDYSNAWKQFYWTTKVNGKVVHHGWIHVHGKVVDGLIRRRMVEQQFFEPMAPLKGDGSIEFA